MTSDHDSASFLVDVGPRAHPCRRDTSCSQERGNCLHGVCTVLGRKLLPNAHEHTQHKSQHLEVRADHVPMKHPCTTVPLDQCSHSRVVTPPPFGVFIQTPTDPASAHDNEATAVLDQLDEPHLLLSAVLSMTRARKSVPTASDLGDPACAYSSRPVPDGTMRTLCNKRHGAHTYATPLPRQCPQVAAVLDLHDDDDFATCAEAHHIPVPSYQHGKRKYRWG